MRSLHVFAICMSIILLGTTAYGQSVMKEKKVSGRFEAGKGKLVVDNQYGKLDIHTWDKNEITVDITITAKANSANVAQELLNRVSITQSTANSIYYKTVIAKGTSADNSGFKIDYVINMPRRHTAEFTNKYGDIDIEDVNGKLSIDLEYGHLKTGDIKGNDKGIKVGFGSATIASIETGQITSSYSKLSIVKAGNINVSNQFEKTIINTVNDLDIDQKYGDLKIGSVNRIKGDVQFAGLTIVKISKDLQLNIKNCSKVEFSSIGNSVDNLDINSGFSNLSFHFESAVSLAGGMDISFGNVINDANNISVSGSGGKGGNSKVKIGTGRGHMDLKVSYGNVLFR